MKKKLSLTLAVLILALNAASCGEAAADDTQPTEESTTLVAEDTREYPKLLRK